MNPLLVELLTEIVSFQSHRLAIFLVTKRTPAHIVRYQDNSEKAFETGDFRYSPSDVHHRGAPGPLIVLQHHIITAASA